MTKQDIINHIIKSVNNAITTDEKEISKFIDENYNGVNLHNITIKYLRDHKLYDQAIDLLQNRQHHLREEALDLIDNYCKSTNAATGSKYDSNSNVINKNIATLNGEVPKGLFIKINRERMVKKITEMYGEELAHEYLKLLYDHTFYKHDETNIANYCASITLYPWLLNGTKDIGGFSTGPTHLKSFCGDFVNLVFMVSGMLSGACSTPEFLMYMSYFIEKEYGDNYTERINEVVDLSSKRRTLGKVITDCFEQIIYSINQPTGARAFQSVFWNIAYYDKYYFEGIFGDFKFPDGKRPIWENLSWLQKYFMKWFNKERTRQVITFPVESMSLLIENGKCKDTEWADFVAEMYSEGHSFFTYMSDNPESLSSCCRLRNVINDNPFSFSLGAGAVSTGSKSVMTLNVNRRVQDAYNYWNSFDNESEFKTKYPVFYDYLKDNLLEIVDKLHKFQLAYNENLKELQKNGLLPLFDSGFININRQYLTIGINGLVESAEFLGLDITPNDKYAEYVDLILSTISEKNKEYRTKEVMFNCEYVPAENLGVKNAKWDRRDGYFVPRDCYNSYFYRSEDTKLSIIDKFKLHGHKYINHLTGGSANHVNLDTHLSKDQYLQILKIAATEGCNYFTFNIPNTVCSKCGHIDKRYLHNCPKCGSDSVDYLTRIIGYLRLISNFSQPRQEEAKKRHYINLIDEEENNNEIC